MAAKKCAAIRKDGQHCRSAALPGTERCLFHSEQADVVRRRRAGRRRGGVKAHTRPALPALPDVALSSRNDVLELLASTINRLQRGEVTPRIASVVINAMSVALHCMEGIPEQPATVIFEVHPPSGEVPDDLNEEEYLAGKQKSGD